MEHVDPGTWFGRLDAAIHRSNAVAVLAALVLLGACDDGPGSPASDPPAASEAEDGGPELPEVSTVDPADVDPDADPGGIDAAIASASAELPERWRVHVVPDPTLGPYVVGLPVDATVWRVGDELDPIGEAAADTAWWRRWEPVLDEASQVAETSSLRSVVVLPDAAPDDAVHLTIDATPIQDLPPDDPAGVGERFAEAFGDQGLTVDEVGTATAGDREVAALTLTTPADEFDDGVPRKLRQWFYPDAPVMWSVTCEVPEPLAGATTEACTAALSSFRPPPR